MTLHEEDLRPKNSTPRGSTWFGEMASEPRTLVDIFRATANRHANQPAIRHQDATLSYGELLHRVETLAQELRSNGVGPGRRVGVRMSSGRSELYVAILAILFAGGAYVPVDRDDSEDRARIVFDNADVDGVFDDDGFHVRKSVDASDGQLTINDDAWVIFTSGSTGTPKGVAVTHRAAGSLVDAEARIFLQHSPLGPGDSVMAGLSVSFDASVEEMWLAWRSGACLVPFSRVEMRSGPDLAPLIASRGISALSTVPSLAQSLTDDALRGVRLVILGGESCSEELARRLLAPGREVWNTYGPTEATVIATAALLRPGAPVTIGGPIPGTAVSVVDENDEPVDVGQIGQLVITGAGLGRYLNQTSASANYRSVTALGWDRAYFTGDFVQMTTEGLRFIGRRDDQVKVSGRRIELGEVEAAASSIRGVRTACAVIKKDADGEARLVCYVIADDEFERSRVHRELLRRLPAGVVPTLGIVATFPVKTSGKVDRDLLPWPLDDDDAPVTFSDPDVNFIAQQWREVLGPVPLEEMSHFFAIGGTSMSAARLVVLLRPQYPSCSVADLYQTPVLSDLANALSGRQDTASRSKNPAHNHRRAGRRQIVLSAGLQALASLRWLATIALLNFIFHLGGFGSTWSWPILLVSSLAFLTMPGRLVVAGVLVRLISAGITAGSHRRAGVVHIRMWASERVADVIDVSDAAGTPWMVLYARLIGCRIGRDVVMMSAPPVTGFLDVGDFAAIEDGVDLGGWSIYSDCIEIGHIFVGQGARLGARSVICEDVAIGAGAVVEMGSLVTRNIEADSYVAGSPARVSEAPRDSWEYADGSAHTIQGPWLYGLGVFALSLLDLMAIVPAVTLYLLTGPGVHHSMASLLWAVRWSIPAITLGLATYATLVASLVRWAARYARPGVYPINSRPAFCSWLIERLTEDARVVLFPLYASVLTPWWMRRLGMRVGTNAEISTVTGQLHLVRTGDDVFLADDVVLAPREIRQGRVRLGSVEIGDRAFVGNSAIVRARHDVPNDTLIGVSSESPANARAHAAYLGIPALEFAHHATSSDAARTFRPTRSLRRARAAVESARIIPLLISYLAMEATYFYGVLVAARDPFVSAVIEVAVLLFGSSLAMLAITVIAKWLLIGRVRRSQHPLWSSFVWRDELAWTFVESLARPWASSTMLGTPMMNVFFRAMGARIGQNVWCETWYLDDPDLVTLGDNVVIGRSADLQTHLFHDRLLRLDHVTIDGNVSIGAHTYVLPGVVVNADAEISAGSLVTRDESVPARTSWWGNPIIAMDHTQQYV